MVFNPSWDLFYHGKELRKSKSDEEVAALENGAEALEKAISNFSGEFEYSCWLAHLCSSQEAFSLAIQKMTQIVRSATEAGDFEIPRKRGLFSMNLDAEATKEELEYVGNLEIADLRDVCVDLFQRVRKRNAELLELLSAQQGYDEIVSTYAAKPALPVPALQSGEEINQQIVSLCIHLTVATGLVRKIKLKNSADARYTPSKKVARLAEKLNSELSEEQAWLPQTVWDHLEALALPETDNGVIISTQSHGTERRRKFVNTIAEKLHQFIRFQRAKKDQPDADVVCAIMRLLGYNDAVRIFHLDLNHWQEHRKNLEVIRSVLNK